MPSERDNSIGDALAGIDRLLEHRARLAVCVLLSRNDRLNFPRLKVLLEETDGSLGAHMRKLEKAEYVSVEKAFEGRKPVTWYALSNRGRAALDGHLAAMVKLIRGE